METCHTEAELRNYRTNTNVSDAVAKNLVLCTTAYLDIKKLDKGLGSGTLVTIDGRLFLATCSHTVPARPHGRLSIIPRKAELFTKTVVDIVGFAKATGKLDVAYLELSPDVLNLTEKEPITLDRISPRGTGERGRLAFLAGFPGDLIERKKYVTGKGTGNLDHGFNMFCYPNLPLQPNEWPKVAKDDPRPKKKVDLFLEYDRQAEMVRVTGKSPPKLVDPGGSSGGGWWQGEDTGTKVWSTKVIRLFGIQSSYWEPGKYIRGVQIHHWLRLLYKNEPKLRKTLKKAFKGLFK